MDILFRFRNLLVLVAAALISVSLFYCSKLKVDNSLSVWYNENDPALESYLDFCNEFGSDEVIITLLADSIPVSNSNRLVNLSNITRELNALDGVSYSVSIAEIPVIFDGLYIRTLRDYIDIGHSQFELDSIFLTLREYRSFNRFLGKGDGATIILTWVSPFNGKEDLRGDLIMKVDSLVATISGSDVYQGGTGVLYDSLNKTTITESVKFVTLSYLVVILLIYFFTRRWKWVLVTLMIVTSANIVLFGIIGFAGVPVTMVTMAIPPLVMVVGVAIVMHISKHLSGDPRSKRNSSSPLLILTLLVTPLLYNTITTSGGFLSLMTGSMAITRNYGLFAAIGVTLVFIFSILFSLFFLKTLSIPMTNRRESLLPGRLALSMFRFSIRNRYFIIAFSFMMLILAIPGVLKITVDTNTIEFLPESNPTRIDNQVIEQEYGGYIPLDFIVKIKSGEIPRLDFFRNMRKWQDQVINHDSIDAAFSVADIVMDMDKVYDNPENQSYINTLIKLNRNDPNNNKRLVSADGTRYKVSFFGPACSASTLVYLGDYIESAFEDYFKSDLEIERSGYLPLYSGIIESSLNDQVKSFSIALIVVILLIGVLLKSFRYTLVSVPSNIIPVILILGFMGFFGIPLDIGTITVAATVLGIIVDDSIHILYHFKQYRKLHSFDTAMEMIALNSGAAIISSTIALCSGFIILVFAGISTLSNTGLLISISVFFALVTDLLILPALLYFGDRSK